MNTEEAVAALQDLIDQIPAVAKAGRLSREHVRWLQNCLAELRRAFGSQSRPYGLVNGLTWSIPNGTVLDYFEATDRDARAKLHGRYYLKDLDAAQGVLESAIDQLHRAGLEGVRRESGYVLAAGAKKIFITHGHAEDVLRRVEDFMRAHGFEPVVVKREASEGQAVDDLVEKRLEECEAQIVLATADDKANGTWQPRMNVIHEVGLGQRIFKDHIIYLKEDKCEFPSNIAPKVWEPFPRANLEPAFQKIAKELHAFGLL
jgi:predicted nucleotide-binding protein